MTAPSPGFVKRLKLEDATRPLCGCPGAEAGRINLDPRAHRHDCRIRRKLLTKGSTIDTSAVPSRYSDGYSLGVAPTSDYY